MAKASISVLSFLTFIVLGVCFCPSVCSIEILPWGVERIHAHCVWDNDMNMTVEEGANAGQEINIAVIDTGVYYQKDGEKKHYHEDLNGTVAGGKRFRHNIFTCHIEELDDYEDFHGHGTHVAGIIAAVDNDKGVIGTAPKVNLYTLKLSSYDVYEMAAAINWSVKNYIDIVSISFYWLNDSDVLRKACDYAHENGLLLVACTGNNETFVCYPACYSSVIAVGAVDENDTRCEWSNPGSELDFVAPGANINSTGLNNGYTVMTGTSQACPHVSGAAALVMASKVDPDYCYDDDNSTWNYDELYDKL